MDPADFEVMHDVRLRPKNKLWWARLIGLVWPAFQTKFWTTVRFPFCKPTIAYPVGINPMGGKYFSVRRHELVHARQLRGLGLLGVVLLYFFLPLPIFFSGRWFVEREAYLVDLMAKTRSIKGVVDTLSRQYVWPWPKKRMQRWFEQELAERTWARKTPSSKG